VRRKYDLIERQCQADRAIAASAGQPPRRHPCGGNLYLVAGNGFGSWTVQFWDKGAKTVRAKGLGSAVVMNLPAARTAAADFKSAARKGDVPTHAPKSHRTQARHAAGFLSDILIAGVLTGYQSSTSSFQATFAESTDRWPVGGRLRQLP
jgi:hypothetical protein